MNIRKHGISFLIWLAIAMAAYAVVYPRQQVDPRRQARRTEQDKGKKAGKQDNKKNAKTNGANLNDLIIDDDSIPDSLLNPRWKIQRTTPITYGDLDQGVLDLQRPEGLRYEVVYNDSLDRYIIGAKFGGSYLSSGARSMRATPTSVRRTTRSTRPRERRSSILPTCTSTSDRPRKYSARAVCAYERKVRPS